MNPTAHAVPSENEATSTARAEPPGGVGLETIPHPRAHGELDPAAAPACNEARQTTPASVVDRAPRDQVDACLAFAILLRMPP